MSKSETRMWYTTLPFYGEARAAVLAKHTAYTDEGLDVYGPVWCDKNYGDGWAAACCAADYHCHHDGWEDSWPRSFALRVALDGEIVGLYNVDREAIPEFTAEQLTDG